MLRKLGLVLLIAVAAGCANQPVHKATASTAVAKKTSKEQVADADTVKCKYIVQTGTRFGTQVCMKVKDWQAREKKAQENAREELQRASLNAQQTQDMKGQ